MPGAGAPTIAGRRGKAPHLIHYLGFAIYPLLAPGFAGGREGKPYATGIGWGGVGARDYLY